MDILIYNDFQAGKYKTQVEKVKHYVKKGDFKSADIKKLVGHDYYRAKLDKPGRLLMELVDYQGKEIRFVARGNP